MRMNVYRNATHTIRDTDTTVESIQVCLILVEDNVVNAHDYISKEEVV
jgi:hypothetical protein